MPKIISWFTGVLACLIFTYSHAQTVDLPTLVNALQQGGYVIVFRHGATNRDQADTDPLHPDNIAQQRLLSEPGRRVAAQVGQAFQTLGIPLGKVYTSKFNRAVETGRLISGGELTSTFDITEGGLVVTPIENDRRTEALRKMVTTMPEAGKNTLIITHKPNLMEAFGKDWSNVKEGEASIFRPDSSGKAELVGHVQAAEWIKAAGAK